MQLRVLAVIAATGTVALSACGGDDDKPKDEPLTSKQVFQRARPATVALTGKLGDSTSGGTGVIIDKAKGLVVTNAHVVQGLASLKATVLDREEVPAQVVGIAPCQDLAVVKLTTVPAGAGQIRYGSSRRVQNQDEVTALGYPTSLAEDATEQNVVSSNGTVQSPRWRPLHRSPSRSCLTRCSTRRR